MSADPHETRAPVPFTADTASVAAWLRATEGVRLDGAPATADALLDRLGTFWLPDEPVLYIGLASRSVRRRVSDYYRTPLGARRPHSGGWFLKTYAGLSDVTVHYAAADDVRAAEHALLAAFAGDSAPPRLPFANLEWPPGRRKPHGISGARA